MVKLPNEAAARVLIKRAILSSAIYELWGTASDYKSLHEDVRSRTAGWEDAYKQTSFRFSVHGYQGKRTAAQQREIIESFAYLGFEGPIKMRGADAEFAIHEDYELNTEVPKQLYMGRWIASGSRQIVGKYDLKKRNYIATTTMDAELALITANLALAAPGKITYDPFIGTGSFSVACAHFGAVTMGSDIDARPVRGTEEGKTIQSNFVQYGLDSCWLAGFVSDLTNTPIKNTALFDAIICDPPYGVREGLKVLGMKKGNPAGPAYIDGVASYLFVLHLNTPAIVY